MNMFKFCSAAFLSLSALLLSSRPAEAVSITASRIPDAFGDFFSISLFVNPMGENLEIKSASAKLDSVLSDFIGFPEGSLPTIEIDREIQEGISNNIFLASFSFQVLEGAPQSFSGDITFDADIWILLEGGRGAINPNIEMPVVSITVPEPTTALGLLTFAISAFALGYPKRLNAEK